VAKIEEIVRQHALKLDHSLELTTCGSYRRGKPDCGDIDILITSKRVCSNCKHQTHNEQTSQGHSLIALLVASLHKAGFLTDVFHSEHLKFWLTDNCKNKGSVQESF
jgi:hypothetical protein